MDGGRALRERAIEDVRASAATGSEEKGGRRAAGLRGAPWTPGGEPAAVPGPARRGGGGAPGAAGGWGAARDARASREAPRRASRALRGDGPRAAGAGRPPRVRGPDALLAAVGGARLGRTTPQRRRPPRARGPSAATRAGVRPHRVEAAARAVVAATSAEFNGLARFHDALRNRTCAAYEAAGRTARAGQGGDPTLDLDRPLRVATLAAPSAAAAIYHVEGFAAAASAATPAPTRRRAWRRRP